MNNIIQELSLSKAEIVKKYGSFDKFLYSLKSAVEIYEYNVEYQLADRDREIQRLNEVIKQVTNGVPVYVVSGPQA